MDAQILLAIAAAIYLAPLFVLSRHLRYWYAANKILNLYRVTNPSTEVSHLDEYDMVEALIPKHLLEDDSAKNYLGFACASTFWIVVGSLWTDHTNYMPALVSLGALLVVFLFFFPLRFVLAKFASSVLIVYTFAAISKRLGEADEICRKGQKALGELTSIASLIERRLAEDDKSLLR